jgi:hypothetical protein
MDTMNHALEYLDRGWSVIPVNSATKRPRIQWKEFQTRLPTSEEVETWWTNHPDDGIALVTGDLSGFVVVDCDNDNAIQAAENAGMRSPVCVKTKRGKHLYFKHPRDGIRRGPRAGNNSRGHDWPRIDGLDFRGDGGYALLPPSTNYEWIITQAHDIDDAPIWLDWKPKLQNSDKHFEFSELDLSDVRDLQPDDLLDEWEKTALYVRTRFPTTLKIPSGMGNARNDRVMRFASECVKNGLFNSELRVRVRTFMREFFEQPLPEPEFEATVASMEESERRNHPERFDSNGHHINAPRQDIDRERRLITMSDADRLIEDSKARQYLIEPWLAPATICQVHGYSGHGKSMFIQHCLGALAAGQRTVGPWEIKKPARVLYCDFEMGMGTVGRRLSEIKNIHGDTEDRFQVWTPFIDNRDMNLKTSAGLQELSGWVDYVKPDVVCIDTVRSAFPGLQENSAEEWARVNTMAMSLRNAGISVILVHHSNKPSETSHGREAGSTNQLTVLDTQIRVTQVFQDIETAKNNAGIHDETYQTPVWPQLSDRLPMDSKLYMALEIRYGKVREWTDEHDRVQWLGFGSSLTDDNRYLVSSRSTKQKAKAMANQGSDVTYISTTIGRPIRTVREWLEIEDEYL